jgi:histone H3/H4
LEKNGALKTEKFKLKFKLKLRPTSNRLERCSAPSLYPQHRTRPLQSFAGMSTFDTVLPTTAVLRVIKQELPAGHQISSEAKSSFSRAAAIFALYLAAAASDASRDGNRKVVTASDVYRALEEVDLPEFVDALRRDLQGAFFCLLAAAPPALVFPQRTSNTRTHPRAYADFKEGKKKRGKSAGGGEGGGDGGEGEGGEEGREEEGGEMDARGGDEEAGGGGGGEMDEGGAGEAGEGGPAVERGGASLEGAQEEGGAAEGAGERE